MACITFVFLPLCCFVVAAFIQAACLLYNSIWGLQAPIPLEQQMVAQPPLESVKSTTQANQPSKAAENPYASPIAIATQVIDQVGVGIRVPKYSRAMGFKIL